MQRLLLTAAIILTSTFLKAQETTGLLFDGIDDNVHLEGTENIEIGTGEFTFEVVIKANATQKTFPIFLSNRSSTGNGFLFGLYGSYDASGRIFVQINGNNRSINSSVGINLMDNTCHHIAVTRDADSLRYYIDGAQVYKRATDLGTINSTNAIQVGIDAPSASSTAYNGIIKEVRIWSVARSAQNISEYSLTQIIGSELGLEGYWRFDEGTGQNLSDLSNNTNDGLLGTDASVESSDPTWSNDCPVSLNTTTSIEESIVVNKTLIKVVDLLGRETTILPNTPIIKIYDDGSAERVILIN